MTNEQRVKLWDAINRYATACGGDTSARRSHGNVPRMNAVAEVERIIRGLEAAACLPGWVGDPRP